MRITSQEFQPAIDHVSAQFYSDNGARVRGAAEYLLDGIEKQQGLLMICSSTNRELVEKEVGERLSSVDRSKIEFVDATSAAEHLLVDGKISESRFRTSIYAIAQRMIRKHGALRVYGEI